MLAALTSRRVERLPDEVRLEGRILFLAEDPALVRQQLEGTDLDWRPGMKLRDDISTDEITPAYICYYYDETLGEFPYLGLKCADAFPVARVGAAGRVRRLGERQAAGEGVLARAVALRRDVCRYQARHRGEHRADLPGELPEPRPAHDDRLLHHRQGAARRGDPLVGLHGGRGRDHPRDHRVRRAIQLQRGPLAGQGAAHPARYAAAADDARRENHSPPLGGGSVAGEDRRPG